MPTVKTKGAPQKASESPSPPTEQTPAAVAVSEETATDTPAPAESGEQLTAEGADKSPLERAQEAARKAKKGAEHNRKLRAQAAELAQVSQHQAARIQQLEQQTHQTNQHLEMLARDPLGALKAFGITPEQLARRVAMEGSPEAVAETLRNELLETKREIQAMKDAERSRQEATRRDELENAYKQEAQNPKKYPNLTGLKPSFLMARTKELLSDLRTKYERTGEQKYNPTRYSNHDLLEFINWENAPDTSAPQSTEEKPAPEPSGKKTATITNKLASAKHAAPVDFSKMSDRQQKKIMAQQLRDAGAAR